MCADLIFTSAELAQQHVKIAQKIQAEPGVTWGIPAIDKKIIPMRGGDVTIIQARPGRGKTTLLAYLAREEGKRIIERGMQNEETVVFVTWEGTVDTIYASIIAGLGGYTSSDFYWGKVEINEIQRNVVKHGIMPLTMIGFSTLRRLDAPVRMSLDVIFNSIRRIEKGDKTPKRKVTLLCMDYLQLIPSVRHEERTTQVSKAIVGAKNLGMMLDIPSVLGAQSGRQVDSYKHPKIPGEADCQWSSQAEQHADKGFSLCYPCKDDPFDKFGNPIRAKINGKEFDLSNDRLLIMRNFKQRGEKAGWTWPLYMEPELLKLAELDVRTTSLE